MPHLPTIDFIALKYFLRSTNDEDIRIATFFQSCYLLPLLRKYVPQHLLDRKVGGSQIRPEGFEKEILSIACNW